jgi:hypothetical protein
MSVKVGGQFRMAVRVVIERMVVALEGFRLGG